MDGNIKLPNCWKSRLQEEFDQKYMHDIKVFLANELSKGKVIYPPINKIFEALNLTLFEGVRIVWQRPPRPEDRAPAAEGEVSHELRVRHRL